MLEVLGQNPTIHIYVFNEDSQHSIPCLNVPYTSYTQMQLACSIFPYSVYVFCKSEDRSKNKERPKDVKRE